MPDKSKHEPHSIWRRLLPRCVGLSTMHALIALIYFFDVIDVQPKWDLVNLTILIFGPPIYLIDVILFVRRLENNASTTGAKR